MNCSECGDKLALFKINGRVKSDKEHDLCSKCFRSLINKVKIENKFTINIDWKDRSTCLSNVKENYTIILKTPNTANEHISCHIKLTPDKASARLFYKDKELPRIIPDIIYHTTDNAQSWIKHWFHKVLDESYIKQNVGKILLTWSEEQNVN